MPTKIITKILIASLLLAFFAPRILQSAAEPLMPHRQGEALIKLVNSEKIYHLNIAEDVDNFQKHNRTNSSIEYIEPNYVYQAAGTPNDMFYSQQFYLANSNVPLAWDFTTGSRNIIIAVLDTGVAIDHPDLKANIWHNWEEIPDNGIDDDRNGYIDDVSGWDFTENSNNPRPKFNADYTFLGMNHGTIVSGVAAAEGNNKLGITGVTWHSKIMPLRVLSGDGTGSTYDVARAIDYARENKADIINLSFVGDGESETLKRAIAKAYQAGVVLIAAAGNETNYGVDMTDNPKYPVCHDGGKDDNWIIGVASVGIDDKLSSFSNYGKCVDVFAVGSNIFSTLLTDQNHPQFNQEYGGGWSGTSVSAPQVAGLAALLKSLKPKLTSIEIRDLLLKTSDNIDAKNKGYAGKLGHGRINAARALTQATAAVSLDEYRTDKIIVSPGPGGGPHVRIFKDNLPYSSFFAFDKEKRFGVVAASADFDYDGREEIVTGVNPGEEPWVKIFDDQGNLKTQFLAYPKEMKNGIYAAVGDVNKDHLKEIVVTKILNADSTIRVFSQTGKLLHEFTAFNSFHTFGLSLAVGDVNGDEFDDIVVSPGPGGQSLVRIFNYNGLMSGQFIAYDANYLRGISLAIGDVDGDGTNEIISGTGAGATPHIRIFNHKGTPQYQFFAFDKGYFNGVSVAAADIDGNGTAEIVVGAGRGYRPEVLIYDRHGDKLSSLTVYQPTFTGGVNVAAGK